MEQIRMGMRAVDYREMDQRTVEGIKGNLTAVDVVSDEAFGVGLRVIPPNSKVPKPGLPYAPGKRVLFVLRGTGTVSNGEYYEKIGAGKFVLMDEGERPNYATQDEELVVLEMRYHEGGRVMPTTVTSAIPSPVDARPRPVATTYDVVD